MRCLVGEADYRFIHIGPVLRQAEPRSRAGMPTGAPDRKRELPKMNCTASSTMLDCHKLLGGDMRKLFLLLLFDSATLVFDAAPAAAQRELMQWRDAQGRPISIPRPRNYAECRENNTKYIHRSEAESHTWCSSPERGFNRR